MSEIEKMYELVQPEKRCDTYGTFGQCPHKTWKCEECTSFVYRPFTAEKQIELIKFITSLGVCEIENWNNKGFHFAIKREKIYPTMFLSLSNINLQETLADVINNLWQDLTEEEKQQVKGILE